MKFVELEGSDLSFLQSLADTMPAFIDGMNILIIARFGSSTDPRAIACAANLLSHYCRIASLAMPSMKTDDLAVVAVHGLQGAESDYPNKASPARQAVLAQAKKDTN